jgi:hypothetical protein
MPNRQLERNLTTFAPVATMLDLVPELTTCSHDFELALQAIINVPAH